MLFGLYFFFLFLLLFEDLSVLDDAVGMVLIGVDNGSSME